MNKYYQRFLSYFNNASLKGATVNLLFGQALLTAIFILFDAVITRFFSQELFATWKQLQILINLVLPLLAFGLPEGYKYYIAYEPEKSRQHSNFIFSFLLLISGLVLLVSLTLGGIMVNAYFKNPLLTNAVFALALLFIGITLNRILRYQLITLNKTGLFLQGTFVAFVFACFAIGALIFLQHFISDTYIVFCLALLVAIMYIIPNLFVRFFNKSQSFQFEFNGVELYRYLKIGFPLYLASFMSVFMVNLDKTIVSKLASLTAFGIYAAGSFEIPIFSMLSASFSQSTFPKYVALLKEGKKQEAIDLWIKITFTVSRISYPVILVLMTFSHSLIHLIYTSKMDAAVPIFKTFLFMSLWRNNYYGSLISASGKTKWITIYNGMNVILLAGGCYLAYNWFGYTALPWAILIALTFINTVQLIHEGMYRQFILKFLIKPYILVFIALIIVAFIYSPL